MLFEIEDRNSHNQCLCCGKFLGMLNRELKSFYSKGNKIDRDEFYQFYSYSPHKRHHKLRTRCFDCLYKQFGNVDFSPYNPYSEYYEYLFDIDLATKRETLNKSKGVTLDRLMKKYGTDEGTRRFDEYRNKQAYTNTFEYKRDKHGWTKEEFDEYNASRAVTKDNLIKRHGEKKGLEKWEAYRETQRFAGCKLEYFVEKYGEEAGTEIYNSVNKRKSQSYDNFVARYGDLADEKFDEYIRNRSKSTYSSDIANKLFEYIDTRINNESTYFSTKTGEFGMNDVENNSYYFFDYTCSTKKRIIEFYGDYWHMNPMKFNKEEPHPTSGILAEEIWKRDEKKKEFAESRGFEVLIVWEYELNKDWDVVVERCVNFMEK